ncbi:hypothetical protein PX668_10830 [Acinetobacter soli]|nr:hypothetical protein [Acinetobacter soli]WEI14731.1 hypothetical protein PX668_10830 [Acinetobacter soli]
MRLIPQFARFFSFFVDILIGYSAASNYLLIDWFDLASKAPDYFHFWAFIFISTGIKKAPNNGAFLLLS